MSRVFRGVVWCTLGSIAPQMASAAPCPDDAARTGAQDIVATVAQIESALTRADSGRFGEAQAELEEQLACLQELLPSFTIASVHRARGMKAFTERDPAGASASFVSAKQLAPDYRFPDHFLPAAHPIRATYDEATVVDPRSQPLLPPADGTIWIDGRIASERPLGRSVVFQLVDSNGGAELTSYLDPTSTLPVYETGKQKPVQAKPTTPLPRRPMLMGSGAGLVVAGGFYTIAATRRAAWSKAPPEDKARLRSQTNTLAALSGVIGLGAVGVGVVALVDGQPGVRLRW